MIYLFSETKKKKRRKEEENTREKINILLL
jgi:hypothetical protein